MIEKTVVPAQAGVILDISNSNRVFLCGPRTGGGDPCNCFCPEGCDLVVPAQAGVILRLSCPQYTISRGPRTGGGDPRIIYRVL